MKTSAPDAEQTCLRKRPRLEERSRAMLIIGSDLHARYQQIAMPDDTTAELTERRWQHENGEANTLYRKAQRLTAQAHKGSTPLLLYRPGQFQRGRSACLTPAILVSPNVFSSVMEWHPVCWTSAWMSLDAWLTTTI